MESYRMDCGEIQKLRIKVLLKASTSHKLVYWIMRFFVVNFSFSSCAAVCRVCGLNRIRESDGHGDRRATARRCQHAKESSS